MPIFRRTQPASAPVRPDAVVESPVVLPTVSTAGAEAAVLLQISQIITSDDFDAAYHWLRVEDVYKRQA